jgi:CheY-like chemotaxis protein
MKKLLIVDDLKTCIDTEKNILSRACFEIFTATSAEEALAIHKAERVDLIITDLDMSGISGDTLCSMIRKDEELKHVSIIIVCINAASNIERVSKCKANSFITKPINPEQLFDKVTQLLNIPKRKSCRVLLKVSVNGKSEDGSFFCSSKDISSTGILLQTDRKFAKGDIISCAFFLPDSMRVFVDAEIMRAGKNHDNTFLYGAKYVDLSEEYRSAIEAFIDKRSKKIG